MLREDVELWERKHVGWWRGGFRPARRSKSSECQYELSDEAKTPWEERSFDTPTFDQCMNDEHERSRNWQKKRKMRINSRYRIRQVLYRGKAGHRATVAHVELRPSFLELPSIGTRRGVRIQTRTTAERPRRT